MTTTTQDLTNRQSSGRCPAIAHTSSSLLGYESARGTTHEQVQIRADFGFCLTGDSLIYSTHQVHGKSEGVKKRRLEDLYSMTQTPHGRSRIKLLHLRCLDETTGTFASGKVKQIICSGVKPVFTVKLADGKTITTTKEHRFLTKAGWMALEDAVGGLKVTTYETAVFGKSDAEFMVNGRPIYQDAAWLREHYITIGLSQAAIAELAGVSPHTIRAWIRKHHLQKPLGSWSTGKTPWNKGLHYQSRVSKSAAEREAARQRMRGAGNHRWRGGVSSQAIALRRCVNTLRPSVYARDSYCCRLCGKRGGGLSIHHILPVWARPELVCDPENMVTLCRSCHFKVNHHEEDYIEVFGRMIDELGDKPRPIQRTPRLAPRPVRIAAIVYAGEQMTYDIEMNGPHRNFVANGIVAHNSQLP